MMIGVASTPNSARATAKRRPKSTMIDSRLRKPAMTSRCCSLPVSFADFGATSPMRFRNATALLANCASSALVGAPVTSPRRRSIAAASPGANAYAAPTTTALAKRNASSGRSRVTSHLDLDHLTDPQIADRLQHDRPHQHHLTHVLAEEEVHVFRVDE